MNCAQCQDKMVAHVEGLLQEACAEDFAAHLSLCAHCRDELEATTGLHKRLLTAGPDQRQPSLETAVMDQIIRRQASQMRRTNMRWAYKLGGVAAAAAAVVLVAFGIMSMVRTDNPASAAQVLARASDAASGVKTVHLTCRMRTRPDENFSRIGTDFDFVPLELWKQAQPDLKWRVEKPGRVIVMDGASTTMYMRDENLVNRIDRPSPGAFDSAWLTELGDVSNMLQKELQAAKSQGWQLELTHETSPSGKRTAVLTVHVKPSMQVDPYLAGKFLDLTATRRVYRFNEDSGLMRGLEVYVQKDGAEVLVLEVTEVQYNVAIDPNTFRLDLPKDVVDIGKVAAAPVDATYASMSPAEVAKAFFDACSREDWAEAEKLFPIPLPGPVRQTLGHLELISLGEPFQAKPYPGWFVPYEIKTTDGRVRKNNLAVRNDNPAHRFVVDGGI